MGTVGHAGCLGAGDLMEGALLGAVRLRLYRWRVPNQFRWWVVATSIGAAVARSIGMLPSTFDLRWTAETAVGAGVGGLLLLTSLPFAQHLRAAWSCQAGGAVDSDRCRCLPIRMTWTLAPSPVVDKSNTAGAVIVIYSIAGLCMEATVAVVTGVGMIQLLQSPVELDGRSQADQARQVIGSAMRRSNSQAPKVRVGFILGRLQLELDVESGNPRRDRDHRIQVEL